MRAWLVALLALAFLMPLPPAPASADLGAPAGALVPPAPPVPQADLLPVAVPNPPLPYVYGDDQIVPVASNQDETSVAVNPLDERNIIAGANDYSPGPPHAGVFVTTDGGTHWQHTLMPVLNAAGYPDSGDPALAFGPDGTAYYAGVAFGGVNGANAIFLAVSRDKGASWQVGFPFRISDGSVFHDKPYIATDASTGALLLTYTRFGTDAGIKFSKSMDQGATWTPQVTLGYGQFSEPVAGPGGELYVAWAGNGIEFRRSLDGGATWSASQGIGDANGISVPVPFRYFNYPTIAVAQGGPAKGTVYVAYGNWNAETGTDLKLVSSGDRGATWSAPEYVTQDPGAQFMPWIAVMPTGEVGVFYMDLSLTPWPVGAPGLSSTTQVEWTVSIKSPGDPTWFPQIVSDLPSFSAVSGFWGDYQGMAAGPKGFHPVWADARTKFPGSNDMDVAHALVNPHGLPLLPPNPSPQDPWKPPAGYGSGTSATRSKGSLKMPAPTSILVKNV